MTTMKERLLTETLLVRTARDRLVRDLMDSGLSYAQAAEIAVAEIRPGAVDGVIPLVTQKPTPALRLAVYDAAPRIAGSFPGASPLPEPSPRSEN